MSPIPRLVLFSLVLAILLLSSVENETAALSEYDALAIVEAARSRVFTCYEAVARADAAGANVTGLLEELGDAAELLSMAQTFYEMAKFDSAVDYASRSQSTLNGFVEKSVLAEEAAFQERYLGLIGAVAQALLGSLAVLCGSFIAWVYLKRRFSGDMRP